MGKKLDKILKELERKLERNDRWCHHNGLKPTPYMEGVNDTCVDLIRFIKKMNKK
jgi:hypothetical protein